MRSRLPARSRWVGWTASTTPTSGRLISTSRLISPTVYIPISSTATWCDGSRRRRVIGRPVSEFRLPSLRRTAWVRASTSAVTSLARVFPVEPVIPTTRTAKRSRHQAARSWKARRLSATRTTAASVPAGRLTSRSTSTATAPAARASETKRWPSVRSPGSATNSDPGTTFRESTTARRKDRTVVGACSRPPVAASRSSMRIGAGTRFLRRRRRVYQPHGWATPGAARSSGMPK